MAGKILITGAGGQVASALVDAPIELERMALTQAEFDITDLAEIDDVFDREAPALVVNAAAYTQVDRAEHEAELAFAINRDGVADLAHACRARDIPLIHLSTDYIFDGTKQSAYVESDPVAPLGVYGESKAEGEAVLHRLWPKHVILRTSWVFSATGNNFVKTMLRLGRERDELGVVNDQHGCPTSARSIAETLLEISRRLLEGETIEWGTYHYCNGPPTTWYGCAREIFTRAGGFESLRLEPIATSDYPTPARRPHNSVLDCAKIERSFGIRPADWRDELEIVLSKLSLPD